VPTQRPGEIEEVKGDGRMGAKQGTKMEKVLRKDEHYFSVKAAHD
jgi:hypothetical protein